MIICSLKQNPLYPSEPWYNTKDALVLSLHFIFHQSLSAVYHRTLSHHVPILRARKLQQYSMHWRHGHSWIFSCAQLVSSEFPLRPLSILVNVIFKASGLPPYFPLSQESDWKVPITDSRVAVLAVDTMRRAKQKMAERARPTILTAEEKMNGRPIV